MRRRHKLWYWHEAPQGFWWVGGMLIPYEKLKELFPDGYSASSQRTIRTLKRAIRSINRWGGLLCKAIPGRGGWSIPIEWGSWDDDGSRARKEFSKIDTTKLYHHQPLKFPEPTELLGV